MVITSPAKLPRSPSLEGVSQASACAIPAKDMDKAATAAPLKSLFEKDIYSSLKSILFTVLFTVSTLSKRAANSSQRLSKRHLKNQHGSPKYNIDFESKKQAVFTLSSSQSALDFL
jgi:hypothetical protein